MSEFRAASSSPVCPEPGSARSGANSPLGATSAGGAFCGTPHRDKRPWTDIERESLRVAWADAALTWQDVADLLRRSVYSVTHQARMMNLGQKAGVRDKRAWRDEDVAELRRLRDETDLTMRQIAARLGRTYAAVVDTTNRNKMPGRATAPKIAPRSKPQRDNTALVAELIRRGISPATANMLMRGTK